MEKKGSVCVCGHARGRKSETVTLKIIQKLTRKPHNASLLFNKVDTWMCSKDSNNQTCTPFTVSFALCTISLLYMYHQIRCLFLVIVTPEGAYNYQATTISVTTMSDPLRSCTIHVTVFVYSSSTTVITSNITFSSDKT